MVMFTAMTPQQPGATPMFTRQQIDAIKVGTMIAQGIDGRFGEATAVTSIHAKQDDIHGKLFVCGYRQYGDNAQMSFSVKEGEDGRFIRIGG
jgi:hypothetical protein